MTSEGRSAENRMSSVTLPGSGGTVAQTLVFEMILGAPRAAFARGVFDFVLTDI
jgi:hypothetical protein